MPLGSRDRLTRALARAVGTVTLGDRAVAVRLRARARDLALDHAERPARVAIEEFLADVAVALAGDVEAPDSVEAACIVVVMLARDSLTPPPAPASMAPLRDALAEGNVLAVQTLFARTCGGLAARPHVEV